MVSTPQQDSRQLLHSLLSCWPVLRLRPLAASFFLRRWRWAYRSPFRRLQQYTLSHTQEGCFSHTRAMLCHAMLWHVSGDQMVSARSTASALEQIRQLQLRIDHTDTLLDWNRRLHRFRVEFMQTEIDARARALHGLA